ncbi:hypothetical protein QTP86_028366 [Hemibagrus guttatus]|nr:hypothetical protein QTP86_028366 [Hemibagrus guttatus]
MPINLPRMSLDWERKPEYPEETPEARGEHANSTHTAEARIEPPTLEDFTLSGKGLAHLRLSITCDCCLTGTAPNPSLSSYRWHQGRIHPGWSANPSQGTHTHTYYGQFRDTNQPTMHVFGLGEETPEARGEHANSTHMAEAGIKPPTLEVLGKRANHQATVSTPNLN